MAKIPRRLSFFPRRFLINRRYPPSTSCKKKKTPTLSTYQARNFTRDLHFVLSFFFSSRQLIITITEEFATDKLFARLSIELPFKSDDSIVFFKRKKKTLEGISKSTRNDNGKEMVGNAFKEELPWERVRGGVRFRGIHLWKDIPSTRRNTRAQPGTGNELFRISRDFS